MNEWKDVKLSDTIEIIGGGTPKTSVPEYWNGDIPWLSVVDFNSDKKYVSHTEKTITSKGLNESSTKYLKQGDIIISARGTVGALAMLTKPMTFNQSCYGLRPKPNYLANDFLYYIVKHSIVELKSQAYGAVFDTITKQTFENLIIKLPPLPEQEAIAEVLSSLDDKIDLLHRNNKTLEEMAETLFRKWFVEEVDENYIEKPLDKIANYLNGLALQKYPSRDGEIPLVVIKIKEMNNGISENSDYCSPNLPEQYIVNPGDILFSWSGSLEIMIWTQSKGALNQHLFKVTSDIYPKWLIYFATKHFISLFRDIAADKATTMGHIQRKHLSEAILSLPPEFLLETINGVIEPLFDKLINNKINIHHLENLRDLLLPKLMSGAVRVKPFVNEFSEP